MTDPVNNSNQSAPITLGETLRDFWEEFKSYPAEKKKARQMRRKADKADKKNLKEKERAERLAAHQGENHDPVQGTSPSDTLDDGWEQADKHIQDLIKMLQGVTGWHNSAPRIIATEYNVADITHLARYNQLEKKPNNGKVFIRTKGSQNKGSDCVVEQLKSGVFCSTYIGDRSIYCAAHAMAMADSVMPFAKAGSDIYLQGLIEEQFLLYKAIMAHNDLRPENERVFVQGYDDSDLSDEQKAALEKKWQSYIEKHSLVENKKPNAQKNSQSISQQQEVKDSMTEYSFSDSVDPTISQGADEQEAVPGNSISEEITSTQPSVPSLVEETEDHSDFNTKLDLSKEKKESEAPAKAQGEDNTWGDGLGEVITNHAPEAPTPTQATQGTTVNQPDFSKSEAETKTEKPQASTQKLKRLSDKFGATSHQKRSSRVSKISGDLALDIINDVKRNENASPTRLAEKFNLTKGAVTKALNILEESGLVDVEKGTRRVVRFTGKGPEAKAA